MSTIGYPASGLPRLRLTTRGRRVLSTLAAVPVLAVALLLGANALLGLGAGGAIATQDATAESFTWISVEPGQSLWDVAEAVAPNADPREFVSDLVALNQLPSADVQAGQRLALPAEYAR